MVRVELVVLMQVARGSELPDGLRRLLGGAVVVRCGNHPDTLAHPARCALPDPVERLALGWVECQMTQAGT